MPREVMERTCAEMARDGLPEWRQADRTRLDMSEPHEADLRLEMPVVFHVVNHKGNFVGGFRISEGEVNDHLSSLRAVYNSCGIAIVPEELRYWRAPYWLDTLGRDEDPHRLGEEQRCLFRAVHRPGRVNVYFVEGVYQPGAVGRSHAIARHWHVPSEPDDMDYYGAAIITDADRTRSTTRWTVVPHEAGHIVMDTSHVWGGQYNVMADSRERLALLITAEQCERARRSPYVRRR